MIEKPHIQNVTGNFFTVSALLIAMTNNSSSQVKSYNRLLQREMTVLTRSKLRCKVLNEIYKNMNQPLTKMLSP